MCSGFGTPHAELRNFQTPDSARAFFQLRQQRLHNFAVDVGEAEVAALVAVGELRVLDAHEVQDRRVEVVHMHGVADDVVAVVVRLAVRGAFSHAGTGEEDAEAARVMVASVVGLGERALRVDGAAKFAAPNDERVIEQAALFEVGEERGGGLVGVAALP